MQHVPVRCTMQHVPVRCIMPSVPVRCIMQHVPVRCIMQHVPVRCTMQHVPVRCIMQHVPVRCIMPSLPHGPTAEEQHCGVQERDGAHRRRHLAKRLERARSRVGAGVHSGGEQQQRRCEHPGSRSTHGGGVVAVCRGARERSGHGGAGAVLPLPVFPYR
jgi:hypothetical protein